MVRPFALALIGVAALARAAAAQYEPVDALVQDGVRRGVYPAAALIIGNSRAILHARGFGHFTWSERSAIPTPDSTLWDIASLTKVVATTSSAAFLVDRGRLQLDAPVQRYLPHFTGPGKERVTVRMLLDHTSGLPAGLDPRQRRMPPDSIFALVLRTPLRRSPGTRAQYSDLNAILLGRIIEAISGRSLDRFAADSIFGPLGMFETRFLPPMALRRRIAPTSQWRGSPLAGEVNDRTSGWLGGVAGHAGVFTTATDLARYAQWWLRRGATSAGIPLVRSATVDTFLAPRAVAFPRLLGWESRGTQEYTPSPYGTLPSADAYGHTGYTGTMLWIDPDRDLFVVLLTNRVFGPRVAKPFTALHEIRGRVADAAVRAVPGACRAEIRPSC